MKSDKSPRNANNINVNITGSVDGSQSINWGTDDPYILRSAGTYNLNSGTVANQHITRSSGESGDDYVVAFISDTRDHDTSITGKYELHNNVTSPSDSISGGGTISNGTKLFYSLNPAGVGGKPLWGWSDGTGVEQHRTATINADVNLHGASSDGISTLAGLELQLYNIDKESTINADTSEWKIASSNSTLLNKGNLNLVDG